MLRRKVRSGAPGDRWPWWLARSLMAVAVAGCQPGERAATLFESLAPTVTGVTFVNELPESPELNILNYLNYYNGGGVAAGDVDGDGRPDLYLTSNLGPDRLYRNLGDFRFEDITDRAGVGGPTGWSSGVTMADVNGDGFLDIHVANVSHLSRAGRNVLYVNDGDGTFTDRTEEYGLGHVGYSTQAAFLDYDRDGDLDMYLLNHSTHDERGRVWNPERTTRHPRAGDVLYRNDGNRFVDVSEASGIFGGVEGYGLGVVASDLNGDGCVDLFVANDFHESDYLYVNNCDGTFTESIRSATGHTSHSSMGVDAADVNNDGRPDVVVLDMFPEREEVHKTSGNVEDLAVYRMKLASGYHPQYARNTLQLNRGSGRFSDIGYLSGVYATDWSWSGLFSDLDNDGRKDLFITNGIFRRPNDLDYITYVGTRAVQEALQDGITGELLASLLARMPQVPLPNYAYRNNGDLTFTDMAERWGLAQPGFSTGAAYADLDGDGALDLVVNNVNAPAAIYRNRARERNGHHYLAIELDGHGANTRGIGARVIVGHDGVVQWLEQSPTRGFQSSVDPRLHVGLGTSERVDSLRVIWPDGRSQVLRDVAADRVVTLAQQDADGWYDDPSVDDRFFVDITDEVDIGDRHRENRFFDSTREPLIPHRLSAEGPALAVGDVDGDGLDDLYVGGAKWQAGQLFVQRTDGRFRPADPQAFLADSLAEDVDAALFDADGDADLDLYVVSAGNEFWGEHEALQDRLYLNDGAGRFRRFREALPGGFGNGSTVVPADFDGDGDVDLFVGGRVVSRQYGRAPRSRLLRNDGTGRFADVTTELAPMLSEAGMVTSAAWLDYDADSLLDLVVVGEWMPIRVFRQIDGAFVERTEDAGFSETSGWWNHVAVADLEGDGRADLVVGNLGLNAYLRASSSEPLRMYLHDFAANGGLQQVLTFYKRGTSYPLAGRDELVQAIPQLRGRFPTYADFGDRQVEEILPGELLSEATVLEVHTLASVVARNRGDGTFAVQPLPTEAQFAPIEAILPADVDGDGYVDLLVGGNRSGASPVIGRYDASYGEVLRGDGTGALVAVDLETSGVALTGEVRNLAIVRGAGDRRLIVVARNDDRVQVLRGSRMAVGRGGAGAPDRP